MLLLTWIRLCRFLGKEGCSLPRKTSSKIDTQPLIILELHRNANNRRKRLLKRLKYLEEHSRIIPILRLAKEPDKFNKQIQSLCKVLETRHYPTLDTLLTYQRNSKKPHLRISQLKKQKFLNNNKFQRQHRSSETRTKEQHQILVIKIKDQDFCFPLSPKELQYLLVIKLHLFLAIKIKRLCLCLANKFKPKDFSLYSRTKLKLQHHCLVTKLKSLHICLQIKLQLQHRYLGIKL